jgi:phage terminase large subunit
MGKIGRAAHEALLWEHLRTERPNARQRAFFASEALHTMYGGARGGGKSWAARRKANLLCINYANLKGLLLRRTYRELQVNHILPLQAELNGYARWKESEKAFLYPNGSRLQLGYCACDSDKLQYQGAEYDFIIFEEATNFEESWITFIATALRTTRADFRPRIYYTCNPGGVSHAYFKRLFIDRQFVEGEDPDDYLYIPATVRDNAVLMERNPGYIKQLEALPENLRRAHLDGDWNVFDGAFFAELRLFAKPLADATMTHVVEPFDIPYSWRIYRSFDWGYSKPSACLWWAVDYDGRAYLADELYTCAARGGTMIPDTGLKWSADQVFAEIHRRESERFPGRQITGVADPAIWAENGGEPIVAAADRHQVYFDRADHTRIAGWMQVRRRLQFGEDGRPMLYIFSTCKNTLRTLPILQYSARDPEDLDTTEEDHIADALRYFCMMSPLAPSREIQQNYPILDPLAKPKAERISYF